MKLCSQGTEALHQWVKYIIGHRSNRKDVAATVVGGVATKAKVLGQCPGKRSRNEAGVSGRVKRVAGHTGQERAVRHAAEKERLRKDKDAKEEAWAAAGLL